MIRKLMLILSCFTLVLACMDDNCASCTSYGQNNTVHERCSQCKSNFQVDQFGECAINIAKLVSFIVVGVFIMALSLFLRWFIILYNTRKKRIYTAEYQQKVFHYMTMGKKVESVTTRAFVPITERGLIENVDQQEQKQMVCNICQKDVQFTNKRVDSFCKCKHNFHAMCLRMHARSYYAQNPHQIRLKCPQCKRRIQFITTYCQSCLLSHRDFEIKQQKDITQLYSYICFRCKAIQKDKKRIKEKRCCCGLGKYLYCHCCKL